MKISVSILCGLLIGLNGLFGQTEQELIVAFYEIDSLQYFEFRKEYSNNLEVDSTKKTIPDSSFTLIIKNNYLRFDCQKDYNGCYYYKGFILSLNSFVITHCGMLTCETFLINQTSGERCALFSPFDNECETPLLSKDLNKMLVFASNVFEIESYISVYQKTKGLSGFNIKSFKGLRIDKWRINEAIWINDTTFALITSDKYGDNSVNLPLTTKYLIGKIKY